MQVLTRVILCILLVTVTTAPFAAEESTPAEIVKQLDKLEKNIRNEKLPELDVVSQVKRVEENRTRSNSCITDTEARIKVTEESLGKLGEAKSGEPAEVSRKRRELTQEKTTNEKQLASCRLLQLRSTELLKLLSDYQQKIVAKRLLAKGPDFITLLQKQWDHKYDWMKSTWELFLNDKGLKSLKLRHIAYAVFLVAVFLWLGQLFRRRMQKFCDTHKQDKSFSSVFMHALVNTYSIYLPYIMVCMAISVVFISPSYTISPTPVSILIMTGLPVYIVLMSVAQFVFLPSRGSQLIINIPRMTARRFAYRFKILATLFYVAFILFASIVKQSIPDTTIAFTRAIFVIVLVINLSWITWLWGYLPYTSKRSLWLRILVQLSLVLILVAELTGYPNLSFKVLLGVFGSITTLGVFHVLQKLVSDFFQGIEHGRQQWHRNIRKFVGLKSGEHFPGLLWFQAIVFVGYWLGLFMILSRIWGMSDADLAEIQSYFIDGFKVGSLHFAPSRIFIALLSFGLLVALSGWLKNYMDQRWLAKTKIDRGTREAIVIISGYSGIAVAIIVGLGVAGVEFKNLAIVAGALSVGIGFGLQNIVNNFISGLILLLERPVKRGDWIIVGTTEGYVKKIRIRSTQIETFDRADVIVPNSEMISAQVTNWMLNDQFGRAKVPVGVAYGSDTEKVKALLLEVAQQHNLVVKDNETMLPKVLFMGFGNSSLDFQLRVYVSDVDKRLTVISDLNFAIDKIFRENHIEIPFPKQDVYIKELPPESKP